MGEKNLQGKVCLITGATNGLGKVTAAELAKMGARVILIGRNPQKTQNVVAEIKEQSGNSQVDHFIADLSSLAEIRKLAAEINTRYDKLDVLVNNVGSMFYQHQLTPEGLEKTFVLNYLGHFLLTHLLLDLLRKSNSARVINLSSIIHPFGRLFFRDLQSEKMYISFFAYAKSKLYTLMFSMQFAQRLADEGISVNAVHPGLVRTNFGVDRTLIGRLMNLLMKFALTPEEGARTILYLASSPEAQDFSGKYFVKKKPVRSAAEGIAPKFFTHLWQESERLTGVK